MYMINMHIRFVSSAILFVAISGCVSGPAQEKKSAGNYLNGEHYSETGSVLGVPIVERRVKNTILRGMIRMEDPLEPIPSDVVVT